MSTLAGLGSLGYGPRSWFAFRKKVLFRLQMNSWLLPVTMMTMMITFMGVHVFTETTAKA